MPFSFIDAISASAACSAGIEYIASTSSILVPAWFASGLWGPAAPLGPVAAPLVPRCALLPAPTPRLRTRFARLPRGLRKGQTWFVHTWVARWDAELTLVGYRSARSSRGEMWNARSSDGKERRVPRNSRQTREA